MSIRVIAVGKKHEQWVAGGIERYEKRLRKPFDLSWKLLPHSSREGDAARQEESARIQAALTPGAHLLLLDERGKNLSSPELSRLLVAELAGPSSRGAGVDVVIGGAYGVTAELRAAAGTVWSLSRLVFPHQLVRLMLTEQVYRAQEIAGGRSYHHE